MKHLFILSAFALLFAACSNSSSDPARLSVRLTDAPAEYEKVFIDIQEIHINTSSDNEEESGWQELEVKNPGVYNLLDFTNGLDTLLIDQELPAGKISQMRMVLGDNNQVMKDGTLYDLDTPSGQQSGLKFNIHATLSEGITYRLWIDFDAGRSVVAKGNGTYSLKPVIRTFTTATSGAIKGNVSPANVPTYIMAITEDEQDTLGTYSDTETGYFLIRGVEAGNYNIELLPSDDYNKALLESKEVINGEQLDLGTIELTEI